MKDIQIKKSAEVYDIVIIGSGAGGGMAGYVLAHAGIKVLMLEAGPFFDPAKDSQQLKWPYESPRRGGNATRPMGDFDAAYGGWDIEGEPYTQKGDTDFKWFRAKMLGGRTNHWARISLRMGPKDFKCHSSFGAGDDWPITYDDIKPYYDKVDRLIGVYGSMEGLENDPDGIFLPAPKPRLNELFVKKAATGLGIKVIAGRGSVLTAPLPGNKDRGACFFCGQCNRSCKIYGDFSASSCLVIPAIKTGNLKVITNAVVREILTGADGLANGVSYINKDDMQEYSVKAKTVILAAGTCESARILLNSKSAQHPNGLANSSNVVGKYLHDSTQTGGAAIMPQLLNRKRFNEDGVGSLHLYAPWWGDHKKLDFARGYHLEIFGGMMMPSYGGYLGFEGTLVPYINGYLPGPDGKMKPGGGFGKSLKEDYRRFYGTLAGVGCHGTDIAKVDNYCEIDNSVVDKYGIPVLRFNYKWGDEEIKQARHMQQTTQDIIKAMGGIPLGQPAGPDKKYGLDKPGKGIHEVGTVRMGDNAGKSALNKWCQAHDCKNLFVVDGAAFTQQSEKNPTWTILALSMRTAEYILDQKRKLNV
ncbi:GMC family oxidoreductase [Mucilaginibacter lappiensis]|uniref:Choline dehydrogenase-like flavoprotein n=1 Tax=Mucilaginibacter lappiensis TaxID=354630 RepID=A0A841J6N8_9SPHI|nr:GMC family oxidoreductase [Mucilaginibacter lappiensis]MBB6126849.1 choline dehydrogenase-like flavoprotein [Mucilaginibacter lappiensis]